MNVDDWDGNGTLPLLYSKTAKGAVNIWLCWVLGDTVCVEWGQENGVKQQAQFKCTPKNVGRANATTAEQQAVAEAIAKWKKCVKRKYHWDRERVLTMLNLKPMLAKNYDDHGHKLQWPATAQPKYDGVRCMAFVQDGKVRLQSRGGEEYSLPHISEELLPLLGTGVLLDGELYVHDISLQELNSLVRRPRAESTVVKLHVYDYVYFGEYLEAGSTITWLDRRELRQGFFYMNGAQLQHTVQTEEFTVCSPEEVKDAHREFVARGFEGAIIRGHGPSSTYRFSYRSADLLKVKAWQDSEFTIVGYTAGKGKFAEYPIFRCKTKDGKEFDCMPNGTDAERKKMLKDAPKLVGDLLKVAYFDMTDDGIPHYPRGLAIRHPGDL